MIEMALGKYPYPPETYSNVFAQLTAIVHGDPPDLPEDKYSDTARDFVARCLRKDPDQRATYGELLVRAPMTSPQPMMSSHLSLSFLFPARRRTRSLRTRPTAAWTWSRGCRPPSISMHRQPPPRRSRSPSRAPPP